MEKGEKESTPSGKAMKFACLHSISPTSSTMNICNVERSNEVFKTASLNHFHHSLCLDKQPSIKQANTGAIENTFPFYVTSRSLLLLFSLPLTQKGKNATSFLTFCLLSVLNFPAAHAACVFCSFRRARIDMFSVSSGETCCSVWIIETHL